MLKTLKQLLDENWKVMTFYIYNVTTVYISNGKIQYKYYLEGYHTTKEIIDEYKNTYVANIEEDDIDMMGVREEIK